MTTAKTVTVEIKESMMQMALALRSRIKNKPYISFRIEDMTQSDNPRVEISIRDYGNWELPDDLDEDEDNSDYDWKELSDESVTKFDEIIQSINKPYTGIKNSWETSEKNHIEVTIEPVA